MMPIGILWLILLSLCLYKRYWMADLTELYPCISGYWTMTAETEPAWRHRLFPDVMSKAIRGMSGKPCDDRISATTCAEESSTAMPLVPGFPRRSFARMCPHSSGYRRGSVTSRIPVPVPEKYSVMPRFRSPNVPVLQAAVCCGSMTAKFPFAFSRWGGGST